MLMPNAAHMFRSKNTRYESCGNNHWKNSSCRYCWWNKNKYRNKKEIYETGLYLKTGNNEISFDKEETKKVPKYEKEDKPKINEEFQKTKEKMKNSNKNIQSDKDNKKGGKNQILNM